MEQLIDFHAPEVQAVLDTLLKDRSTGKNIIWATDPPDELQTVMYESVTDEDKCKFVLWVGNKRLIKRRLFDSFVEQAYSI